MGKSKNESLAWERLNELFEIHPDKGLLLWKKNPGKMLKIGKLAGDLNHRFGYVVISIDRKKYKRHRLIWFYVHRVWPSEDLDHINGIRSDDRIDNLRKVHRAQNLWNAARTFRNTSGHKGVSWQPDRNKWKAYINANGVNHSLGDHERIEDAIAARKSAEQRLHKGFARNDNNPVRYPPSHASRRS